MLVAAALAVIEQLPVPATKPVTWPLLVSTEHAAGVVDAYLIAPGPVEVAVVAAGDPTATVGTPANVTV